MIAEFFGFVLDCFFMVVKLFKNTVIDGISFEVLLIASCMLSIVLTSIIVRFRPSFRAPDTQPDGDAPTFNTYNFRYDVYDPSYFNNRIGNNTKFLDDELH